MQFYQDVMSFDPDNTDRSGHNFDSVNRLVNLITSLLMLILLVVFLIYVCRLDSIFNRQRFELTILFLMIYRYSIMMLFPETDIFNYGGRTLYKVAIFSSWAVDHVCHWSYASQYLKTCFLVPDVVNKAYLLLAKHLTVIKNRYS